MGNRKPGRFRLGSFFLAGLPLLLSGTVHAEEAVPLPPLINFPVVCDTSKDCFIQHYFDYDPGPEALDHTCGILTYNGHQGIDIRVSSPQWMEKGFPVIAAAKGKVELTKDGVPDRAFSQDEIRLSRGLAPKPSNSVVINHGDGWRTHYGHMRQGSVIVKAGQEVSQGALLGLVGLSGSTSFPHLHFHLSYKGTNIDPFTGLEGKEGCEAAAEGRSYWSADANAKLGYKSGGVFKTGFSDHFPRYEELETGNVEINQYPPGTNEFYFWVNLWGIRKGDQEEFRVRLPDGDTYQKSDSIKISSVQGLRGFFYSRNIPLPTGVYHINYKLRRPGKQDTPDVIINIDDTMEILPQPSIFTRPPDE
ncbi:M23 family metallopeptidase [Kiloniella laminariae]|uniref:M23 family metallopeptidase n=1 Tax=Kiloniella laminariae TaxID=454162 RepID=UPI0012FB6F87|nr:M23 family metallopeptidase [Kiloniella laminariae]